MKVSVIVTVKNEGASIGALLDSLFAQSRHPDEIVIVDGGSTDGTVDIVRAYAAQDARLKLLVQPGASISEGRNAGIRAATGEVIAVTDAGVRLVEVWLAELLRPFGLPASQGRPDASANKMDKRPADSVMGGRCTDQQSVAGSLPASPRGESAPLSQRVDVVSGFFQSDPRSAFELALGATVLPALDEVDPDQFLPSSRSVAFRREAWTEAGGYPEWLDYCEDLVFDLELRRKGYRFAFAPKALARFRPRTSPRAFFRQYYRYARGDGKAGLWPWRNAIRYVTYVVGPVAIVLGFCYKIAWLVFALMAGLYLYRPYRHLLSMLSGRSRYDCLQAILWVPAIRVIGDMAKMAGYPVGLIWRWRRRSRR